MEKVVRSIPKAKACREIRSRKGQAEDYLEMIVEFDTDSLTEAHALSHEIEHKIKEKYGNCEVIIHIEPLS